MGCVKHIKSCEELKKRNFGLYHEQLDLFYRSQWPIPPVAYLLFRWALAAYVCGGKIYTIVVTWHHGLHFIFLTNWTFFILTFSVLVRALSASVAYVRGSKRGKGEITQKASDSLPWHICCEWVLYNIATTASLLVTLMYWVAIYQNQFIQFTNFNAHAMNSVIVLLDLAVSATPIRLFHVYQPMLYVIVYGIFAILYWAAGGTDPHGNHYIYKVLDWGGNPKLAATLAACLGVVGIPVIYLFVFGLYKLRVFIHQRTQQSPTTSSTPSELELTVESI